MIDIGQFPPKIRANILIQLVSFSISSVKIIFTFDKPLMAIPPEWLIANNFPFIIIAILIIIIARLGHSKKEAIILPSWLLDMPPFRIIFVVVVQRCYFEKFLFRPKIRKLLPWVDITQFSKPEKQWFLILANVLIIKCMKQKKCITQIEYESVESYWDE